MLSAFTEHTQSGTCIASIKVIETDRNWSYIRISSLQVLSNAIDQVLDNINIHVNTYIEWHIWDLMTMVRIPGWYTISVTMQDIQAARHPLSPWTAKNMAQNI